jgi:signal transduction histidine kinase/serine phosphatase RsbU (regulator of sigma subunit)
MRLERLKYWFASIVALPTDSEEVRSEKTAMLLMSSLMSVAGALWPIIYLIDGRYLSALIPGSYAIITFLSIFLLALTKQYAIFRFTQLLFILVLPFLLHWSLGGFSQSSVVMMWAFLPMIGAIVFHRRYAMYWFGAYQMALIFAVVMDNRIHDIAKPLPTVMTAGFWLGNIGGVTTVIFLTVRYAFQKNTAMLEEVRKQRLATERAMAKVAEQAEQLKELDKTKTLFFANISHELRTPLTLLLGPLDATLQSSTLPEDAHRRLTLAARNGRRLLRQINLLLDFTKAESGKMDLDLRPENPAKLASSLVEDARGAAAARSIELVYAGPSSMPLMEMDRDRLEQALLNLIGNAIKFTPEGGRITVSVGIEHERLLLRVSDTGIGIPKDQIPRLFQSFGQARRTESSGAAMYRQEHQGTGLGLAMAKQIVELHKGRIGVDSELNKGTTFWIRLPLVYSQQQRPSSMLSAPEPPRERARGIHVDLADVEQEAEARTILSAMPPEVEDADDVRPRILLVDDHADVRSYLRDLLQDSYRLLEAGDGQEGIDRAKELLPDLIISDVMMPKKSGFELLDELKNHQPTRGIPIMLLTARGGVEGTVEGLKRGADDYLAKPFAPQELTARVFSLLRLTSIERELAKVYAMQKEELEEARAIQESLMPATSPRIPRLEAAGRIITASELGGDFYDFVTLGHGAGPRKLGVAIGDVTGHGASSALVTAVAKAALETHATDGTAPSDVVSNLGRVIYDSCKGKRLMTFFYGVLDTDRSMLHYCNAGHTFPWIVNSQTGSVRPLTQPGMALGAPLGVERQISYKAHTASLSAGDVLLLFSDGLVEAESKAGQPYGTRRLRRTLEQHRGLPAEKLVDTLLHSVMEYCERPAPEDDITAVVVRLGN